MRAKSSFAIVAAGAAFLAAYFVFVRSNASTPESTALPNRQSGKTHGKAPELVEKSRVEKYLPKSLSNGPAAEAPFAPKASLLNPQQLVAEAEGPANNGSASAMYWMSLALKKCSTADKGSNDQIEAKVALRSVGREAMQRDRGQPVDANVVAKEAADTARMMETLRDECAKLPADQVSGWQDWLEKSAAAGNSTARAEFAHSVMNEFKDISYKEEHYEEFSRKNALAIRYLNDSAANGDCGNDILNGFRWVQQADAANEYIYQSLLLKHALLEFSTDTRTPANVVDRETLSLNAWLRNLADKVPRNQLADAEGASDYILSNVCKFGR